jgi:hypothetical protein
MRSFRGCFALLGLLCALSLVGCGLPWLFPQPTPDATLSALPDAQQALRVLESGSIEGDLETP